MKHTMPCKTSATKQVSIYLHVLLLLFAAFAVSCTGPAPRERKNRIAVRTGEASIRTLRLTADYIGTVHSIKEVNVLARIPGRVLEIPVQEGEEIESGDVVARLAAPELKAAQRRTNADRARAKAEKMHLCYWAEVHEGLAKKGTISRNQAESSRRACSVAEASFRAASASAGQTAAESAKSVERAPFDGMVLKRFVEPGENMMPGRPMLLVGGKEKEIRAWVTEADISAGIRPGAGVLIEMPVETSSGVLHAEVTRVAPRADGPARLFETGVKLPAGGDDNSSGRDFRHGSSASLRFILREEEGTAVPVDAVLSRREGSSEVFVIRDERALRVQVKEIMRDEQWALVSGGIRDGDTVAVSNVSALSDGAPVFPVSQVEEFREEEGP